MKLQLGPIVGAVTHESARIWLQTDAPGECLVDVRRASGGHVPGSPFLVTTSYAAGNTATATVPLPAAYASYGYDIRDAGGRSLLPEHLGSPSFWSAPFPGTAGSFAFGLISCNKMSAYRARAQKQAMWRRLGAVLEDREAAFLVAVGDQVYADAVWDRLPSGRNPSHGAMVHEYRRIYESQWSYEAIEAVLANVPTYMTWDDHEIRNGWGSKRHDGTARVRRERFAAARQVYREFQHAHNPSTFDDEDLFYAFRYGNVGFLALDLRGHRDIGRSTDPLLGRRQWTMIRAWIGDQAAELGALFVIASVPVVHVANVLAEVGGLVASDLRDQWAYSANRLERLRILDLLFDVANDRDIPVALLGGDVHVGTVACIRSSLARHERRPTLYQFTSSPISNRPIGNALARWLRPLVAVPSPIGSHFTGRVLDYFNERNFGVVDVLFDDDTDRYRIAFDLYREGVNEPFRFPVP